MNKESILATLSLVLAFTGSIAAQSLRISQLHGSVGVFSLQDADATPVSSEYSESPWSSEVISPIFSAGFIFFEHRRLEIGADIGYQHISYQEQYIPFLSSVQQEEQIQLSNIHVATRLQLKWLTSGDDRFKIYSNACFGLDFISEDHSRRVPLNDFYRLPTFHFSLLGMRFGDKVAGFFELGAGFRGIIHGGISVRL